MKTARKILNLSGCRGTATLYALSESIDYDDEENNRQSTRYIIASACVTSSGPEVYLFPANSQGVQLSWMELPGSIRNTLVHTDALERAGFKLIS